MICTSITLRKTIPQYNEYGAKTSDQVVETEVPIMKFESVRANEYYRGNEQGFRPELRVVISILNYNGEEELEYNGTIFTIIRKEEEVDTLTIIAERKLENV